MSSRTPPKSKMTARRLVAGTTRALGGLGRRAGRLAIAGERHPAALLHALLVQLAALGALVAIARELAHRVVGAGLVPLAVPLRAAAEPQERRGDDGQEAMPAGHFPHGVKPPTHTGDHHRREAPASPVGGPAPYHVMGRS